MRSIHPLNEDKALRSLVLRIFLIVCLYDCLSFEVLAFCEWSCKSFENVVYLSLNLMLSKSERLKKYVEKLTGAMMKLKMNFVKMNLK